MSKKMNKLLTYITAAWIAAGTISCEKEIEINVTVLWNDTIVKVERDTSSWLWDVVNQQQNTLNWYGQQITDLDSIQNQQGQAIEEMQQMLDGYLNRLDGIEKKLAWLDGYEDLKWDVKELQAEVWDIRSQIWELSPLEQLIYLLNADSGKGSILERLSNLESQMKEIENANTPENNEIQGDYPLDIQDAFNWAYEHGFTNKKTIEEFWPYWTITREEFFTLINNIAGFYKRSKVARNGEKPQWPVNKTEVLACVGRLVYGELKAEKWDPYYKPYVNALQQDWIIKNTDDLDGYYSKGFIVLLFKKVATTAWLE